LVLDNAQRASRDIDMRVARPASAQIITLFLFTLNWILAHSTIGLVVLCRRTEKIQPVLKYLLSVGAIILAIPQLRNTMPDAPGFDGVLIDTIGYFPQMILASISGIAILLILASREFDDIGLAQSGVSASETRPRPPPAALNRIRPPPLPTKASGWNERSQYDMNRMIRHLQGEFVFPPVPFAHNLRSAKHDFTPHRRTKTISGLREGKEGFHYPS